MQSSSKTKESEQKQKKSQMNRFGNDRKGKTGKQLQQSKNSTADDDNGDDQH